MPERAYEKVPFRLSEVEHSYGPGVHLLADPFLLTQLNRLCSPLTKQPTICDLLRSCYQHLLIQVLNRELPQKVITEDTRMIEVTPRGRFHGAVLDPATRAITVSIARAGTMPSQICYELLNQLLDPDGQRQDFLVMQRTTDAAGRVTGAGVHGAKIGGSVEGCYLICPDPMAATGSSILKALDYYRTMVTGKPAKILTVHLIVTPEYIRAVKRARPEVEIYAIRLDRGLSPEAVLDVPLGEQWDREQGLTDQQYIVPGGGGLGEVLNNAYP